MSNDDVRKLLAGYATNTLTEAERKTLFEAALKDQELFDALQEDQAVKDVLDDPASRAEVHHALIENRTEPAKWMRWWVWSGAATAAAAAVLIVAFTHWNQPVPGTEMASRNAPLPAAPKPAESVSSEPGRSLDQLSAKSSGHESERAPTSRSIRPPLKRSQADHEVALAPPPPPATAIAPAPAAAPEISQQSASKDQSLQTQSQSAIALAAREGGVAGGAVNAMLATPIRYTVLKQNADGSSQPLTRDKELRTGDAVRLLVVPASAGYLSLERFGAGEWKRVFPNSPPGVAVTAEKNYTIPDSPVQIQDTDQQFRLRLIPASGNVTTISGDRPQALTRMKASMKEKEAANPPIIVYVTLPPGNPR